MPANDSRKAIPIDEAIDTLVELYRERLNESHEQVVSDWLEHMDEDGEVEWRGEECVLLVDE